ncbi:MAG: filamentous hemagglutinin family protein, partial [Candidatus Azotimanducaceae bacterium]
MFSHDKNKKGSAQNKNSRAMKNPNAEQSGTTGMSLNQTRNVQSISGKGVNKKPLVAAIRNVLIASGMLAYPHVLLAGPEGGVVTAGSGFITKAHAKTTITQSTQNLAIDWQSFNVAKNESVQFLQPGSQSVALNRILDQDPSVIHGSIQANGTVFLMNPNGTVFGETASVNVHALVASTLLMSNSDFMSGNYNFSDSGTNGVIVNHGLLAASTGGSVTLLGHSVENHGVIVARTGTVTLASGTAATLDFDGDGLLSIAVTAGILNNPDGTESAVLNTGTISAEGGTVYLTADAARDVFKHAVNNVGLVEARGASLVNGEVILDGNAGTTITSGTIDVSNETGLGGTVKVLGEQVGLFGDATINASGSEGGGTVLVGGNYQGKGPEQNAQVTYVSEGSSIQIGSSNGDGGQAVVWADGTTRYFGHIDGAASGKGANAEVSGKQHLAFRGTVDLSGGEGKGTLLLDPQNIVIATGGGDAVATNDEFAENAAGTSTISPANLVTALDGASVVLQAHDDITVTNAVDASANGGAGDLTLEAGDDITIDAAITMRAGSSLNLIIDSAGATGVAHDVNADITGTGAITAQDLTVTNGATDNDAGNVTFGVLTLAGDLAITTGGGTSSTITQGGAWAVTGTTTLDAGSATATVSDITLSTGANDFGGAVTITQGGDVTIVDANALSFQQATAASTSVTAGGVLTLSGNVTSSGATSLTSTADDGGAITFDQGGFTISSAGGALTVTADDMTLDGTITATGQTVTLTSNTAADAIELGSAGTTTAGTLELSNTELQTIAATQLNIGSGAAGAIAVTADVTPGSTGGADVTTVHLLSGSTITGTAGGIVETSLALTAAAGTINFTDTTTNVTDLAISAAGQTASFTDVDSIDIDTVAGVTGITATTVNLTGSGTITDSAASTITGTTTLDSGGTTATTNDISLDSSNDFGVVAITQAGNVTLVDAASLDLAASAVGNDLTVTVTTGNLTDSGTVTVTGATSLTTSATDATINMGTLASTGAVTLATTGAFADATVVNATALDIGASAVGGSLIATATTGNLTDSGTVTVGSTSTLTTSNADDDIDVGDLASTGAVSLNTTGTTGNATIVHATGFALGASTVNGILTATATTGNLTDSGTVTVTGTTSLTTSAADATIDLGTLASTGAVTLGTNGTAADASIVNATALDLAASAVGGNLIATATTGNVTDSGTV